MPTILSDDLYRSKTTVTEKHPEYGSSAAFAAAQSRLLMQTAFSVCRLRHNIFIHRFRRFPAVMALLLPPPLHNAGTHTLLSSACTSSNPFHPVYQKTASINKERMSSSKRTREKTSAERWLFFFCRRAADLIMNIYLYLRVKSLYA